MKYGIPMTTLALFLAAGTAVPALAQQESKPSHDQNLRQPADRGDRANPKALGESNDFRTADTLQGRDIINHAGEDIGDVSDFVIDRGSGRIEYAVVTTGAVLGLGGKTIAIPYGALKWNQSQDKFVLNASEEQLKRYPEFTADRWSAMMEAKDRQNREMKREARERDREARKQQQDARDTDDFWNPTSNDPYAGSFDPASKVRIEGKIVSVDRRRGTGGEETIVTVKANDGSTRRVSLGPSWFVGGGAFSPARGDEVVIESYAVRGQPDLYTATSARSGGKEVVYRGADHAPAWTSHDLKSGERSYGATQWRYLLADDLKGMKVDCRGNECGKVDEVIVERGSGEVAFLSIDPNQNFLGMGDTKRLVPWAVATVSMDKLVRIDADKDMILASPETPSDAGMLSTGTKADMVYRAFKVQQPDYERRPQVAALPPSQAGNHGMWSAQGEIARAMDSAPTQNLSGKVQSVKSVECGKTGQTGKAITIRTRDNREETVVLGPAWYVDAQPAMEYETGDEVSLEACKVNLDGKALWIAKSLEHKGQRTAMWKDNGPVWDR